MSDLPPGFELESDGLPPGFEIEAPDVSEQIVRQATGLAAVVGPAAQEEQDAPWLSGLPSGVRRAADVALALNRGIQVDVPQAAIGLMDIATGGATGKYIENNIGSLAERGRALDSLQSPASKRAQKAVEEADGIVDTTIAAVQNPSVIVNTTAQSLPSMLAGGIAGRALGGLAKAGGVAPAVAGAAGAVAGEGIVSAGAQAEQIRQQTPDGMLTPAQSVLAATTGVSTSLFGALGRKVAAKLGINDIDSLAAGQAGPNTTKAFARRMLEGAVAEGLLEELPQSVAEQVLQNYALGKPLDQGVDQAAVLGAFAGAALGAGANLRGGSEPAPAAPRIPPPAGAGPAVPPSAPAPTAGPAVPPAGPAAAPPAPPNAAAAPPPFDFATATDLPPLPATIAPEPAPKSPANSPQGARPPAIEPPTVDIENFGNDPLPGDLVREQFLTEQGFAEQPDGTIVDSSGAAPDPADADNVRAFLAEADEVVVELESQSIPVTPETVRRELQNRQRVRDLQADRASARTPEAQAVLDQQIAAASQPAGGPEAELQALADTATERGDKATAKAAQDAIKQLKEPADGAVADGSSAGAGADLGRGVVDSAGAGSGDGDAGRVPAAAAGTAPAGAAPVAVGSGAVQPTAGVADQGATLPLEKSGSPQRGKIGGKLSAGEVVTTASGRNTTPFPKIDTSSERKLGNTLKRVDEWLMQNALDEAEARGDEFNARSFRQDLKNPPPASKDSAEEYLFGDEQPPVLPKILKPLVAPRTDEGSKAEKPAAAGPKASETALSIADEKPAEYGASNKLVSKDRAAELRERLKSKLNEARSGIDPEILAIGTELAVFHIEAGARKFADFAQAVAADLDMPISRLRSYLRGWYNGARDMMEDADVSIDGMDAPDVVRAELAKLNDEAGNEQGTVRVEDPAQPEAVAPETDEGTEGDGSVRGDGAGPSEAGAGAAAGADGAGVSGARGRGSRKQRNREPEARGRRDAGAVGESGAGEAGSGVSSDPVTPPATNIPAANFEIDDNLRLGRGGEVEKFNDNMAAIEALKRIEAENRRATADEQSLLARYVGWGGLANAFPDPSSGEWGEKWKARGPRLRELLTKAEYTAARRSTRNAHYTSEPIVRGMWRAARRLGFKGGMALESSMGVGNFLGLKPADLPAKFIGIEYDSLTARIAGALYPQATVLHSGFQSVPLPENTFALSIGNPPFGSESLRFQYKPELNHLSIHNQFFVGALDAVRPGGLHIAVVSRFLMDAQDSTSRLMLAERGELVAAIRLPDTAFKENARTEVVTDIIILRRHTASEQESMKFAIQAYRQGREKNAEAERQRAELAANVPEWVKTVEIADPLGGEAMRVNSYFNSNPQNIIGILERSGSMKQGADITVRLDDAASLERRLNEIVDRLPANVSNIGQDVLDTTEQRYALLSDALKIAVSGEEIGHVKLENDGTLSRVMEREGPDGSLLMTKQPLSQHAPFSDQLAMDENGRWYRNEVVVDEKGATVKMLGKDGKPSKRNLYQRRVFEKDSDVPLTLRLGKTGFAKLKSLVGLRDLLKKQLVLETEDADSSVMEANRKKLAKAYAEFVEEHGPINRAATLSLAMTMPDGGLISALEVRYQPARSKAQAERSGLPEQEEEAKSAPILRERVVPKYEPPTSAGSAADALAIVLAERGSVDIERIAQLRGSSVDEAIAELQKGDKPLVFLDPETQLWESRDAYLSGQVRRKLAAARNAGLELNIAALEAIQPAAWGSEDVTVKIGATWVPPEVYAKFVEHLIGGSARVDFSAATNSFSVDGSDWDRAKRQEWGTERAPANWIMGRMLNSLPTSVYDTDSDGKQHLNQEETQLAQIKAREISNAFDEWIFNDGDQRKMLVDLFNEKYNTRVSRQFDGSHLTLPGKVPDAIISMRRHQKNAIWRGISTKALLLDHVVGAGKTFTGIARVMERRRMGISRKPAIVVPNHLVEQWAADVYRLYPAAKVLAAGKSDFEAKNRRKLFGKIATGDWDVVIIPHSSFGFIGISPDTELRYLEREMAQAQAAIEEAWEVARENGQDSGRRKPFNVKEAERLAEKLQGRIDKLREGTRDKLLTYEQLGIDDLTIDEAHEFKNLFYSSRLTGVRGMGNKTGSRKAADLYNKVRVTRDVGGAVTFMTGTPVSNSAVELYTMMRYLVPEALDELGLTHFDAWRAQYVDASPAFEPTETGRLKQVTRMGRQWENMRSLMDLYYTFADAVSIDDIKAAFAEDNPGREFPVPKVKGGDRQLVKIEPTEAQVVKLNEIIAGFDSLDGITDPFERNAARLRLMDQARKVSLDIRAVDPRSTSAEQGGKLEQVSAEVKRIYDASTERRGTQLIFLDRSVPKSKGDDAVLKKYDDLVERQEKALRDGDEAALQEVNEELEKFDSNEIAELRAAQNGGWNAYQQIKDNLIALGVPAGEIRFIQEANTDEQKDALFDAVRGGKVRVLLGSTPRMGAGTNVQDRLVGLHHVDVTWKPSDIEQREGRIIRQGNLFATPDFNGKPNPLYDPLFEVEIKAYATERTVDSKMWSLNATKLKTINGLRKYDGAFTMQIDDSESVSMAEMAALASGNPLLLERVQLDSEINDLELQQRAHRRKVMGREDEITSAKRIIADYPAKIETVKANVAEVKKRSEAVDERIKSLSVDVEGKAYTRLPDAQKAVLDAITAQQTGDERAKYAVAINGKRFTNKMDIADALGEALGDAEPFEMKVDGKVYVQRTAAARAIRERVLKTVETMGDSKEETIKLGEAFGYELVGDLYKVRGGQGSFKLDFALVDGNQTILSTYGPDFLPSSKDALSIQALRPAVGGIFSEYLKRGSEASVEYYQSALDDAQRRLPDLEAKPVPQFAKADELAQKIARLKEVVAALSDAPAAPTASSDESPEVAFSRGSGIASARTVAKVEGMVSIATASWANTPEIIVVASMQDKKVPEAVRMADAAQKAGGAEGEPLGWIIRGTVYINAGAVSSPMMVLRTLHHEALGHFGLRSVFGTRLDDELKKVALLRAKDIKAKMAEYGMADTPANRLRAAEEVLARMAETNPQLPLVQRVLAAIRSFLRPIFKQLGITLDLSDAEIIRDYLIPARDYVRKGSPRQIQMSVPAFNRVIVDRAGNVVPLVDRDRAVRPGEVTLEQRGDAWGVLDRGAGVTEGMVERAKLAADDRLPVFNRGQSATDAFKRWFGGSKVVDAEGKPLVVYHGTSGDFSKFLRGEGGGMWFASTAAIANKHAARTVDSELGNVMPVYLSMRNPVVIDGGGADIAAAVNRAYKEGRDGVIAHGKGDLGEAGDVFVVFSSNQIKSAIGNNGNFDPDSDRIDFNRGTPARPATWQQAGPSSIDTFIQVLQDKNVDLKRAMQAMREAGQQIADAQDAYEVEEGATSRKGFQTKTFLETEVKPLLAAMRMAGVSIKEIEQFALALHAKEANERIAEINPDEPTLQDGGSGMTTQDAQDYLDALDPARRATLDGLSQRLQSIIAGTRQLMVDSGLEKAETIAEWEATYENYVPLKREGFEDQASRGGGQGVSVKGSSTKARLGSNRAVVDILANVIMEREKIITRAENNRVGQALLGLAITNPNPDVWAAINPDVKVTPSRSRMLKKELVGMGLSPADADGVAREPFQRYLNPQTGLVETRVNPALRDRDNVIAVRVKGKDRFIFFKQDNKLAMRMAGALKNLDVREMGQAMRGMASITRYFASINTQYNIVFGQVNFLRDIQTALLNLSGTAIGDQRAKVLAETLKFYGKAARRGFRLDAMTGADAALWQRFQAAGGPTGYQDLFASSTDRTTALQREIDPASWADSPWGKVFTAGGLLKMPLEQARKVLAPVFNWLSAYNTALENVTRLAAFKAATDAGMSDQKAASLSKNLTANFNRRGAVSQQAGAFYAFFNASAQGTASIVGTVMKREGGKTRLTSFGKTAIAGGVALGVIQALALAAAGFDQDEPPEWVRERNLILPDIFSGSGKYVTIPMPLGWHVLPNIGRKMTELFMRGGEDATKETLELMTLMLDAFNPIGSGTLAQTISPTIADPVVALATNEDWNGRKISRQDFDASDPTPGFTRGRDNANFIAEAIAHAINGLTGGTDYTAGKVSPTPEAIEYLGGQVGGGVYREANKAVDTARALVTGADLPPYRVPLLGRLYGNTTGQAAIGNKFYDNVERVNRAEREVLGRKADGKPYREYLEKHPEALLGPAVNDAKRDIAKLRKEKRDALAGGASMAQVQKYDDRIKLIQQKVNDQVK